MLTCALARRARHRFLQHAVLVLAVIRLSIVQERRRVIEWVFEPLIGAAQRRA